MAAEQIKSLSITNLDSTPIIQNTAGQGAAGRVVQIDDYVACAATPLGSTKSVYRLVRIPTGAVMKALVIATNTALDTNASNVLAFDFNIAWPDDIRYLPNSIPAPAAGEATIPTTANDGVTTTTVASYASPNLMFGTYAPASHTAALGPTNILFNGVTSTYTIAKITQQPLWQTLGFVDGRGNPQDPGGWFDILAYVSTAAATGAAGFLYCKAEYGI